MRSTPGTIASTSGPLCGGGMGAAPEKTAAGWKIVDERLAENEYLAGKNFTIGDIPLGVWAYRWFKLPIERPPLDRLARWYGELQKRPAYQKYIMIPIT